MRAPDFDELIGADVPAAERARLRRVHDLLVAAGPPPEIPSRLAEPPVRSLGRRRALALLLAAAFAVASFAAGWLLSDRGDFDTRRSVPMRATAESPGASALIRLGYPDASGNWQMELDVENLRPLPEDGYYVLLLTKDGEPVATCGSFKVGADGAATVRLGASYKLSAFDGWIVRPYVHGRDRLNETTVLRTERT